MVHPFHVFTTKISIQNCFLGRTSSIVKRFSIFLHHILGKTKYQILPKILCLQLNEIEDTRKIPLSESRNYAFIL